MCCIIKVFYEAVGLVIFLEGSFVLFVPRGKMSTTNKAYVGQTGRQ
jgi:uncharacterized protein YjeT (DUF2065 family)